MSATQTAPLAAFRVSIFWGGLVAFGVLLAICYNNIYQYDDDHDDGDYD